jgi:hypothetical protein
MSSVIINFQKWLSFIECYPITFIQEGLQYIINYFGFIYLPDVPTFSERQFRSRVFFMALSIP